MFASAGLVLKLHNVTDNQLEPISVYKPKKIPGSPRITQLSWCHDNSYIGILPEESFPQIISSKDRANLNLIHTIQVLKKVTAIQFKQHTKRSMALGNAEGEVILYDTKNRNILRRVCNLNCPIRAMEFNDRDEQLAVATDKSINIFADSDAVNNFTKEDCYTENCTVLKYHPVIPNVLAVGYENGCVVIRDTEKSEVIASFQKHCAPITGINYSNRQKAIITTGIDKKVCVYDYTSSECLFRMNMHQAVTCCDVSTNDVYIAVGLEDGSVSVCDIRDPLKPMITSNTHNSPVSAISFEKGPVFAGTPREKISGTTLNQSEAGDYRLEYENDGIDEKFKQDIVKMMKNHMTYLEVQLNEHCNKFQNFIMNEFDSIHNAMSRWDVFNVGDSSEVAQALGNAATNSIHSTTIRKSHCNNY
ncbi:unnamed protein product [Psylliodes chrysocephalus]|uniref:Uncharacterized protein n=1 Tax=Psylliodes chrysocephalus TaxID=3402493 RepID=A0A9P0CH41_9CUCU|nr:unnamed protein product [Psylliodes chrysocephala]